MQRVFVCFRRRFPTAFSLAMWLAAAGMGGVAAPATLTSRDGKKRDFPVVVAAAGPGLTVRESVGGRDVLIPWDRMDLAVSMEANEWLRAAHAKAVAGGVVALNLGFEGAAGAEAVAAWRTARRVVAVPRRPRPVAPPVRTRAPPAEDTCATWIAQARPPRPLAGRIHGQT